MIALLIVGGVLAVGSVLWLLFSGIDHKDDKILISQWAVFCIGIALMGLYVIPEFDDKYKSGYDQGQIDALHGIQTHERYYVYPQGDTIPSDTLYVKIEE